MSAHHWTASTRTASRTFAHSSTRRLLNNLRRSRSRGVLGQRSTQRPTTRKGGNVVNLMLSADMTFGLLEWTGLSAGATRAIVNSTYRHGRRLQVHTFIVT